jgi:hypothetical protein
MRLLWLSLAAAVLMAGCAIVPLAPYGYGYGYAPHSRGHHHHRHHGGPSRHYHDRGRW